MHHAVDRHMFDAYIEQILAPTLRPGDILVMDNLSAHKSEHTQSIVKSRQAEILFLPAYSPDFNPIEKMWSSVIDGCLAAAANADPPRPQGAKVVRFTGKA